MQWQILTPEATEAVYNEHMVRDFPPEELKPLPLVLRMMAEGSCRVYGVYDDAPAPDAATGGPPLAAYLILARPAGCRLALLDYFAVLPAYRACGLGSTLLATLRDVAADTDGVLIESELPERSPDPALAQRRLGFYARAGAADTGWCDRAFDAWFRVLVLPCGAKAGAEPFGALTADEAAAELDRIYRATLPGEAYRRFFEMHRM